MALRNIGVDYEVVGISEIDKYAIKAYEATHGDVNNLGDISKIKVDDIPEHDLFTYSFPCQDISVAGATKGIERGKTRSGLLYECERIIEHCKPKYLLMENVKNLVGKKFKPQFDEWLKYLENLGYTNYWQVLNAKDYGIPQNRERVFVVSILGEHKPYNFPKGFKLKKNIKSILEEDVNIKYYLSDETVKKLILKKDFIVSSKDNTITEHIVKVGNIYPSGGQNGNVYNPIGISPVISAGTGVNGNGIGSNNAPKIIFTNNTNSNVAQSIELPCIGASRGRNPENPTSRAPGLPTEQRLEINTKGVSNTLTTVQKDNYVLECNKIIKIDIPQVVKKRKYVVDVEKLKSTLKERKIKSELSNKEISKILNKPLTLVEHWFRSDSSFSIPSEDIWFELKKVLSIETNEFDESITTFEEKECVYEKSNRCYFSEGIAPTLTCGCNEKIIDSELKIRKLTPRECFKLMGVSEEDIDKIQATGISETQQYKMAGNSIVVPVLEGIFRELFL